MGRVCHPPGGGMSLSLNKSLTHRGWEVGWGEFLEQAPWIMDNRRGGDGAMFGMERDTSASPLCTRPPFLHRGCACLRTGCLSWGPPLPRPSPLIPAVRNSKS